MSMKYKVYNSAFKYIKGVKLPKEEKLKLKVLKGEKFAFQLALISDEKTLLSIGSHNHIGYKGLEKRVRINIENQENTEIEGYFLGQVLDDDSKTLATDQILKKEHLYNEVGEPTMVWIEGKINKNYNKEMMNISIDLFTQKGYETESKETINLEVEVVNQVLSELKDSDFHLDLWQHLSSWAREYEVEFWGDNHFKIIDNYMEELASLGEKVITVVASDFTWEGQNCFLVEENVSNLFEHNIVQVKRNKTGKIECDFTALERFLNICFKHGIKKEIDIFGILASWKRTDFGNPIKDYDDNIRIGFISEEDGTRGYIDNKEELGEYLKQLFDFFKGKNLMEKVRVMSDMPRDTESFKRWSGFLREITKSDFRIKMALHEESFMDKLEGISDVSLSLPLLIKSRNILDEVKERLEGELTWYVCWFPDKLNHFISSPLMESRMTGWYSYYMGLNGFLRWDYALWTSKPFDNVSYKYPRWKAGDMFFVYPGKDMKPMRTVRWENLRFGIQDQEIMKIAEKKVGRDKIETLLGGVLGDKTNPRVTGEFSVEMDYSIDYNQYMLIKNKIIELIEG